MILLSHPTGNQFVRALIKDLQSDKLLHSFYTTFAAKEKSTYLKYLPTNIQNELLRRSYKIPSDKIKSIAFREICRHVSQKFGINYFTRHERGFFSIDSIYKNLDKYVAKQLPKLKNKISGVYCYEDCALETFKAAKKLGLKCFYELPIAYWKLGKKLLNEEMERFPNWKSILIGTNDSKDKLKRKTEEINLADVIICPSKFVYNSLPKDICLKKKCYIIPFGSPEIKFKSSRKINHQEKLRILFVGSLTQRKGLADLFSAMRLLDRPDVELIVMGSPLISLEFYYKQYSNFIYEKPQPHKDVLKLMQSCDIFVLPSIVEGRALVMQEAMSCGLPLIITPNTGGEDLIKEGKTGFLIPIRSPEKLAEKIRWFVDNRKKIPLMAECVKKKAEQITWDNYSKNITDIIKDTIRQ